MGANDDLIKDFLIESYEGLELLNEKLVALEENPDSHETLSSIFRTFHSIKGSCGFLELHKLEALTHAGENLLSDLREGKFGVNDEIATALLSLVDAVNEMLAILESTGVEGEEEYQDLITELKALREGGGTPTHAAPKAGKKSAPVDAGDAGGAAGASLSTNSIRIQVGQLDSLMNLASELVLARNRILQLAAKTQDADMTVTSQRLNLITSELQEGIMKIRMQPIGGLWRSFPRLVRDLAKSCGKSINLHMEGQETELDKTVLEAVKDPLNHILRNSVDHGLETPAEREAAGKSPEGKLQLRAYHESGQVIIEVRDDGRGMDPAKLKEKAIQKGLLTPEQASELGDRQALNLIFHAGFSTAAAVTNLSGRGVGMDVVRTNIEAIGGSVEVISEVGRGTLIRVRTPLTLAIIPALIVTGSGDRYAIPQVNLVELVRLEGGETTEKIEHLHDSPVFHLRGELLPLVFLDSELGVEENPDPNIQVRNIVVVRADDNQFGLVVDEINDTEEIVVKPLDRQLKNVNVYAGTTILGDGRVSLILDLMGLAERAQVIDHEKSDSRVEDDEDEAGTVNDREVLLVFRAGDDQRMAVPLEQVSRLEEFPCTRIERVRDMEFVQYRDGILPLVRVASALQMREQPADCLQVIVHEREGFSVGLVVQSIEDICEVSGAPTQTISGSKPVRAMVIEDQVTDVLDMSQLIDPSKYQHSHTGSTGGQNKSGQSGNLTGQQFCTFWLGDLYFGVDVERVQEVLRWQRATRAPLSDPTVMGLINLRGQTVTVLDARKRLHVTRFAPAEDAPQSCMNVVLRTEDGVVSVLVDRVGDVLTIDGNARFPVPGTVDPEVRQVIQGVYRLENELMLHLDVERLVSARDPHSGRRSLAAHSN